VEVEALVERSGFQTFLHDTEAVAAVKERAGKTNLFEI